MKLTLVKLSLAALLTTSALMAAPPPELNNYLLPLTCAELLPDNSPFMNFFEAVARYHVNKDKSFSRRMFRVLALREKLGRRAARETNPIDTLIRKTLCFYRETKEPIRPVPYDDDKFNAYLKLSLKDMEVKVDDAIFQYEYERQQKNEFEKQISANQGLVNSLQRQADDDADRSFDRIANAAKRKAQAN